MDGLLFDPQEFRDPPPADADGAAPTSNPAGTGRPRLRVPHRDQVEFHQAALDELLEPDHPARVVWAAVCGLDLGRWLGEVKAIECRAGRDANDPRVMVALWVYATLRGVGSARELARLCDHHIVYKWLRGGVGMNHSTLAAFRSGGGDKWDALLTQIVASLLAEDLVTMDRVAQDGMRVRADAGQSSFRRRPTLERCLEEARTQVETLKRLADDDPEELTNRQRAARQRAATERHERVEEAIRHCGLLQARREATAKQSGRKPAEARASTTDPEARVMKFPDGGYRPGYNVQFATDTASGVIVGVDVTNEGTDSEQLPPMVDQLQRRYDRVPPEVLVDGGFVSLEAIEAAEAKGCTVYAPLKDEAKQRQAGTDPHARKKGDSDAIAAWRARMGTVAAAAIYRLRGQTAEWVNAQARNHGFWSMPVRGLARCRTVAVLYAITHDLLEAVKLRAGVTMKAT
jgi:transposase